MYPLLIHILWGGGGISRGLLIIEGSFQIPLGHLPSDHHNQGCEKEALLLINMGCMLTKKWQKIRCRRLAAQS